MNLWITWYISFLPVVWRDMSTIACPSLTWASLAWENLVIAGTDLWIIDDFSSCFHCFISPLYMLMSIFKLTFWTLANQEHLEPPHFGLFFDFVCVCILDTETTEVLLGVPNPMSSPYNTGISSLLDWPSLSCLRLVKNWQNYCR